MALVVALVVVAVQLQVAAHLQLEVRVTHQTLLHRKEITALVVLALQIILVEAVVGQAQLLQLQTKTVVTEPRHQLVVHQ